MPGLPDHIAAPSANESVGDSVYAFGLRQHEIHCFKSGNRENDEAIRTAQKNTLLPKWLMPNQRSMDRGRFP